MFRPEPDIPSPPFNLDDWPNPTGAAFPQDLRGYIQDLNLQLLGKDKFFGAPGQGPSNLDWPVPLGPIGTIGLRTWLINLSQTTLAPPFVQPPFSMLDWKNPGAAGFPIDLRSFLDANRLTNPPPQPIIPPQVSQVTGGGRWYGYYPTWDEKRELAHEIRKIVRQKKTVEKQLSFAPNREDLYQLIEKLNDIQKRLNALTTDYAYLLESWKTYRTTLDEEEEEFLLFISANL